MQNRSPLIFSGSSNPELADEIASLLSCPLGSVKLGRFPDGEIDIEILESVQNRTVYLIQSGFPDPDKHFMQLLCMLDALKRGGAKSVTVVLPYYGYARQDRVDKRGVPITAKLAADMLTLAGASRVITMDLHSEQIEGFFDIPVEQLLSRTLFIPLCASLRLQNPIVMAPDKGGVKIAMSYAKKLKIPIGLIDKTRIDSSCVEVRCFVGDVKGRTVILPDDMCATGETLIQAAIACKNLGAVKIIAFVGHGLLIDDALKNIDGSPIECLITTNSVSLSEEARNHPKIRVISVAPLFSEAFKALSAREEPEFFKD